MKKTKAMWNPLNPETTPAIYSKQIGDIIEKLVKKPDYLKTRFNSCIDNRELKNMLADVQLKRRTSEKPRWQGASGYKHQIDESFSTEDEKIILLIENKHWQKSINYQAFSAFLIRLLDIAAYNENRIVFGIIFTPQGHQGRAGGSTDDKQCIGKIQDAFNKQVINKLNCYVDFSILTDQVILETQLTS